MSDSLLPACVLCLLALSALSSACYIQNCPRGGKRSQPEPVRQVQTSIFIISFISDTVDINCSFLSSSTEFRMPFISSPSVLKELSPASWIQIALKTWESHQTEDGVALKGVSGEMLLLDAIASCCLRVSKHIRRDDLRLVSKYEIQHKSGVCEIDAVVLHIKKKWICADLRVLKRLKKLKKNNKPKRTGGVSCGARGRCAAPGVCCDSESCVLDPDCSEDVESHQTEDGVALKGVSGEMLLRLLNLATRRQRPF
ncbi:uncharacterized protein LOC109107405 [Cyprinus carpio]|uniref:Uncharacterized protein LOC109107405 n=1 Tax=Cyprinus carpio TaxID=7962 RepID=A0A9Q9WMV8_CYPCA|nr:uncharacterized protein LOC109107405 [Cyprinus carpio]